MKAPHVSRHFRRFLKAYKAVSALEYAILVGVIAVAVAAALVAFGSNIQTAITGIGTQVTTGAGTATSANLGASPAPTP